MQVFFYITLFYNMVAELRNAEKNIALYILFYWINLLSRLKNFLFSIPILSFFKKKHDYKKNNKRKCRKTTEICFSKNGKIYNVLKTSYKTKETCYNVVCLSSQKSSFDDVLQKRLCYEFRKFHRKTSVLESFFLIKLQALRQAYNFVKERLQHKCPLAKFLRPAFFKEDLLWLLLPSYD